VLKHSLPFQGKGKDEKLLERTWQMEFYRAATSLVDSSVCVSPDVRHMFGYFSTEDQIFTKNERIHKASSK
jgi:hypothetical protein